MPLKHDTFSELYKPDVLSCLADLSNDEVFTPPGVANQILDMLPQELFRNPDTKFLDPACKSGVFLREIAKRLIDGLADKIPDLQERCDWIFQHQLYGIAITELTSLLSRRSLYCSKYANSQFAITGFDNVQGNIIFHKMRHTWDKEDKNGHCIYCGTPYRGDLNEIKREGLENHAYEFIHVVKPEEIIGMKFDVIVSNPPYQLTDGGGSTGKSAIPIYQKFVQQAMKLNPRYISMIIPSRWFNGGKGLNEFRQKMLNDKRLNKIVDYADSKDCFPGVDIPGGVCYFLWERDNTSDLCTVININKNGNKTTALRRLDEFPTFIRNNEAVKIVEKVVGHTDKFMDSQVLPRRPFGLDSATAFDSDGDLMMRSSAGMGKIRRERISSGFDLIDKWKVIVSKVSFEHAGTPNKNGQMRVLSVIQKLPPNSVCTESYLVAGSFENEKDADKLITYLKTKFVRFLIMQMLASMNMSKSSYAFVPAFSADIPLSDTELFEKYQLEQNEIDYINNVILPLK